MTANLTPDPETGAIATWSYERFKERFQKEGRRVKESIMPWETFVNYSDDDLKAVYKYLMSLPPVKNDIGDILVRRSSRFIPDCRKYFSGQQLVEWKKCWTFLHGSS